MKQLKHKNKKEIYVIENVYIYVIIFYFLVTLDHPPLENVLCIGRNSLLRPFLLFLQKEEMR